MVIITVGDIYSYVNDRQAASAIRKLCRARPDGYQFMPRYVNKMWDGYISLMNGYSKFPTGLLQYIIPQLEDKGYKVTIANDSRIAVPTGTIVIKDMLADVKLRDYQIEAANRLLEERRGVAKMATNSGKTEIIAAIIKSLHKKTVVLVHRKELLHQTARRIELRTGMQVGLIGDGIYKPEQVTVCMVQSLGSHIHEQHFKDNVVVIIDECHHVSSNQMLDILFKLPGCYRFGFSGTPLKYEALADMKLMAATGPVVYEYGNSELIDAGWSAMPIVKLHTIEEPEMWESDYLSAYDELIVNNVVRNTEISNISKEASGVVLVLVNRIEHGKILKELIPGAMFVHGGNSTFARMQVLEFMKKIPGVYIATPIFDEGIDVPSIDTVVLAAGGKSHIKLLQRIGRGLRKKDGDNTLIVHDFIDDTNKYLFNHSESRVNVYASERFRKVIE